MQTKKLIEVLEKINNNSVPCVHVYKRMESFLCPLCGKPTHDYNWVPEIADHIQWAIDHPDHEYEVWSI